jgi:hypothetical protein
MRNRTPKLLVYYSLLSKRSTSVFTIVIIIDFAFKLFIPFSPRLIWIIYTLDEREGARLRPLYKLPHHALRTAICFIALPGTLLITVIPRF